MSGYWQALERSAGLASASARPRPRARFEEDWAEGSDVSDDPFDEQVVEVDATPPSPTPRRADIAFAARVMPDVAPSMHPIEVRAVEAGSPPMQAATPPAPKPPVEAVPAQPQPMAKGGPDAAEQPRQPAAPAEAVIATPASAPSPETTSMVPTALAPIVVATAAESPQAPYGDSIAERPAENAVAPVAVAIPVAARPIDLPASPEGVAAEPEPPDVAPPLTIEIGEIAIRILSDTAFPSHHGPRAAQPGSAPSLGDYLTRRAGDRR